MSQDDVSAGRILVGPAGWSYQDWEGQVYPKPKPRGFDALRYLAQYVDAIEINSTFYRIPEAKTTQQWVDRVALSLRNFASPPSYGRALPMKARRARRMKRPFDAPWTRCMRLTVWAPCCCNSLIGFTTHRTTDNACGTSPRSFERIPSSSKSAIAHVACRAGTSGICAGGHPTHPM